MVVLSTGRLPAQDQQAAVATIEGSSLLEEISRLDSYPPPAERNIKQTTWTKLTSDKAFHYTVTEHPEPQANNSAWQRFLARFFDFISSPSGKVVIWVGIALLIAGLVVYILRNKGVVFFSRRNKKWAAEQLTTDPDEFVPDDWQQYIQRTAAEGQYRLALRYGYRYLLQILGAHELLNLQPAKTNYQYLYELSQSEWYQPFSTLTRQYEYAWYGGFEVSDQQFRAFYDNLMALKQKLGH